MGGVFEMMMGGGEAPSGGSGMSRTAPTIGADGMAPPGGGGESLSPYTGKSGGDPGRFYGTPFNAIRDDW